MFRKMKLLVVKVREVPVECVQWGNELLEVYR